MKRARLILDNGMIFEGVSIGADTTMFGELVFNTSMTGYQEALTDPSYASQVVVMTYPEIGNTGINPEDFESDGVFARGLVVKNYCYNESHYLAEKTLSQFLKENGIAGISGVDTRRLTRILRTSGAVNCVITTENVTDKLLDELERYKTGKDLVLLVTRKNIENYLSQNDELSPINIALIDYGVRKSLITELQKFGCNVTVYPADVEAEKILDKNFDAVFLSSGAGNPTDCKEQINNVKRLVGSIPIFGIGLGYQILALANGAEINRLPSGHRGSNHPVKNLLTGNVLMTSQNHSFEVAKESLNEHFTATYVNLNDNTLEGFEAEKLNLFGIQFQPLMVEGPNGALPILTEWCTKIRVLKQNKKSMSDKVLTTTKTI